MSMRAAVATLLLLLLLLCCKVYIIGPYTAQFPLEGWWWNGRWALRKRQNERANPAERGGKALSSDTLTRTFATRKTLGWLFPVLFGFVGLFLGTPVDPSAPRAASASRGF